ncbi:MAG: aldo/keto reductase [Candidatus Sumerlaeia bacterium]|nr:aldo/keto reductase [Candidatus Sumerlaeia bacterium]
MRKPVSRNGINRREFVGRTAAGLAAALAGPVLAAETKLERRNEQSGMVYQPFGKTGLNVSRLTFGCIRLSPDHLPILEMAVERGVNLVHTSNGYLNGEANKNLGLFLKKPGNRDKVWIMLKGEHGKGLPDSIDDQLKVLNTDHVDILCLPVWTPEQIKSEKELAKFEALRKAGKVRFYNLTTHQSLQESMEAGLDAKWYSTILSVITPNNVNLFRKTLQRANQENVGIMAMKTQMGRGKAQATPEQVVSALFPAGVTTVLRTLNTREEVDGWFAAVSKAAQQKADAGSRAVAMADGTCTLCGLCEGCPRGVDVQAIVRDYSYYYEQQGLAALAAERYAEIQPQQTAAACGDCGLCESKCPMGLPVRSIIREAHARLSVVA